MNKINSKIKGFWGISEVGFSIMATTQTTFFVFFLTDVAQLPLGIIALITGSTAIVDAISAVVAGIVIDKTTFKHSKYRPWLLYCCPLVIAFFTLSFTKIGGNVLASILISLGYILGNFFWNIAWTANRNLIPKISSVPEERAFLSGRIAAGSMAGKIIASYLVPSLSIAFLAIVTGVGAYTLIALLVSVIFTLTYLTHYLITKGYDEVDKNEVKGNAVTLMDMAKGIVTNPPLIAFLLHDALRLIAFYGIAASLTYYAKIVLQDMTQMKILMVLFFLGGTIGSLISKPVVAKMGGAKKATYAGVIAFMICHAITYFIPANVWLFATFLFLGQLLFGISYGLTSNMYAMCGTYSEWKTGKNTRGVVMSFCSLAIKLAIALRGVIIAFVLVMINYDPTGSITASAQSGIKTLLIIVPVIFLAVSLIPLFFFKLDDKRVAEMEEEIAQRAS